jgi:hypothetical protein
MRSWAITTAIIVAIEYVFAVAIGVRVGFHHQIPFETYMTLGLAFAGCGVALIVLFKLGVYATQAETSPTRRLATEMPYIVSFVVAVLLSALQISVLTWTKIMLPIASPFWADPLLADVDHSLFRVDPWILANHLLGWAAPLFDRAYITWAPLKFAAFLLLACAPESRTKSRALIAYFLMMASVAIGQYLFSSAGPVFYEKLGLGTRFNPMPVELWVATARDYLWAGYISSGGEIGGGISAMPSLHVAASLWLALVALGYKRQVGIIGLAYFLLISIGSVLLGWHYAVDAIVGICITAAAWILAPHLEFRQASITTRRPQFRAT